MSTFHGGPADGVSLLFQRGPLYLRVVQDASGGFDVLDLLDDEPNEGEQVFVYRRRGDSIPAHLNNRGSRKGPRSGWYEFAEYEHVEVDDETRSRLRETAVWREWVGA